MDYEVEPIRMDTWLPDRCMPNDPFDPDTLAPEAGCHSLAGTRAGNSRVRLTALYHGVLQDTGCCGFITRVSRRVAGYINFFPLEIARELRFYGWGDEEHTAAAPLTLVHHCISLARNPEYRRKRIGTSLVTHSLDWAASIGWKRFEVHMVLPDTPKGFALEQKSCRAFWQPFGFRVYREMTASLETRELYGVDVRFSMVLDLEDW